MSLLLYAAPFNLLGFIVGSIALEGAAPWREIGHVPLSGQLWILTAAVAAALFNLFSFLLVARLGAASCQVVATLKTPSVILVSFLVFAHPLSSLQLAGFCLTAGGVWVFQVWGREEQAAFTSGGEEGEGGAVLEKMEHLIASKFAHKCDVADRV